jgi:Arm DNA-binding domain
MLTESELRAIKPVRYLRKVTDGRGLYLLVTPRGGRWWRFAYRFARKGKTLALGTYPDVPLERARARHEFARDLLAHGIDPSELKKALGKYAFVAAMREWEVSQDQRSTLYVHCAPGQHWQPASGRRILSTD